MTSDEMGPKGLGCSFGVGNDIGDETASVVQLTGIIKWFDVSKGYGFIIPDNGMPDIPTPTRRRPKHRTPSWLGRKRR